MRLMLILVSLVYGLGLQAIPSGVRIVKGPCSLVIRMTAGKPPSGGILGFLSAKYQVSDPPGKVRHTMHGQAGSSEVGEYHYMTVSTRETFQGFRGVTHSRTLSKNGEKISESEGYSKVEGNKNYFWQEKEGAWQENQLIKYPEPVDGLAWEIDLLKDDGELHHTQTFSWVFVGEFTSPRTSTRYQSVFVQLRDFKEPLTPEVPITLSYYAPGKGMVYNAVVKRNAVRNLQRIDPTVILQDTWLAGVDNHWPGN